MPPNAVEAGVKDLRVHFIREAVTGTVPGNPAWLRYSDSIQNITESPNANVYQQRPVGNVDVTEFLKGPEDHQLEIVYELQNWFTSSGDAATDGLDRASDGALLNTHSYLSRQDIVSGGILSSGRRVYTVGKGGRIGSVGLAGDPNTGEPMKVTLGYTFEKMRSYEIAQPAAGGVITIVSDSAADSSQTVTVTNEAASSSETIALNGVTPVAGSTSFTDIDSLTLSAECTGDVSIKHTSVVICTILGKTSNGGYEGDIGIPALGSGSFQAALGSAYEFIVGSTIQRGSADLEGGATVRTFEINVNNNLDVNPRVDSRKRRIIEGTRAITAVASIFSEIGSHESFVQHIKAVEADLVWTTSSGSLTLTGSALTTMGGRSYESGQAVMTRGNTFTGKGLTIA